MLYVKTLQCSREWDTKFGWLWEGSLAALSFWRCSQGLEGPLGPDPREGAYPIGLCSGRSPADCWSWPRLEIQGSPMIGCSFSSQCVSPVLLIFLLCV